MLDVKRTIANAIEYCCSNTNKDKSLAEAAQNLKTQDTMLHSRFRYSIANDIARYVLSCYGYIVKDIKLYGSTMACNAGKYSDIDLIINVENMGEEIRSNIKALDHALTNEYYLLIGEEASPYVYLLDTHIIDESSDEQDSSNAYLVYILNYNSISLTV